MTRAAFQQARIEYLSHYHGDKDRVVDAARPGSAPPSDHALPLRQGRILYLPRGLLGGFNNAFPCPAFSFLLP